MLIACISARAKGLDVPADLPVLGNRETLEQGLTSFGTKFVHEVSDPAVIAVFRLAIAEAVQAPEVERDPHVIGGQQSRAAPPKNLADAHGARLHLARPAGLP